LQSFFEKMAFSFASCSLVLSLLLFASLLLIDLCLAEDLLIEKRAQLGSYNVNPNYVHVSGISAGAYFAVQFAVAYSSLVKGAGAVAGGPYYCA